MGEVYFYHLARSLPEVALAQLLPRALAAGWRVVVRGTDPARMARLDEALWLLPDDGFLPHGLAGGPQDADQPVLLTHAAGLPGNTACLMSVDGAAVTPAEAALVQRVCILFDGNDPAALTVARQQWREVAAAGLAAQYWSEEGGRWEKRQETVAAASA